MKIFKEMQTEKNKFFNKNKKSDKFKTYANKLDDFMTSTNYLFNDEFNRKEVAPFIETGIPKNFVKKEEQSKTIDEANH
jgi:hypothetical protein